MGVRGNVTASSFRRSGRGPRVGHRASIRPELHRRGARGCGDGSETQPGPRTVVAGSRSDPPCPTYLGPRHRTGLLVAALVVSALPLSGCAMALRVLSAAEGVAVVGQLLAPPTGPPAMERSVTESHDVHAVVGGTRGSGLRLNGRPGADRLSVLPDGTHVAVSCRTPGPHVNGPYASTSTWVDVRTSDGHSGYMSIAYLVLDADPATVPSC